MNKEIKNVNYEFLIDEFLKSYNFYYGQEETICLMKKIINREHISILSADLESMGERKLSLRLSRMVLSKLNDEKNHDLLIELLPDIINNNIKSRKRNNTSSSKKIRNSQLKKVKLIGTLTALGLSSFVGFSIKNKPESHKSIIKQTELVPLSDLDIEIDKYEVKTNSDNDVSDNPNENKVKKNNDILNNYKKCKKVSDILKRQKQLESLNLTKEDKIYKSCKLSAPLQRFIYEQSILNKIPPDFTFSIIYTETRGGFNSSGEESYNAPGNYDLGLTQQNTKSSLVTFCDKYKVSYDKAYKLLKNNDYVNVVSAFLEYKEIANRFSTFNPREFAGCYNGWLNWEDKAISREYVSIFDKAYNNKFTKHHKVIKKTK